MRHSSFIPDSKAYTEPGYIAAVPGFCDEDLRFTFRPLLVEERAEHVQKLDRQTNYVKKQQIYAQLMAERLVSWSLKDGHDDPVDIRPANILRLKQFDVLYGIILGIEPSQIDPEWTQEDKSEVVDAEYESAMSGAPVTDRLLEGREKNSEGG